MGKLASYWKFKQESGYLLHKVIPREIVYDALQCRSIMCQRVIVIEPIDVNFCKSHVMVCINTAGIHFRELCHLVRESYKRFLDAIKFCFELHQISDCKLSRILCVLSLSLGRGEADGMTHYSLNTADGVTIPTALTTLNSHGS